MTKEMVDFLVEASENASHDAEIFENYSGRGMFGKTTMGVVVDSVPQLLADVLKYVSENVKVFYEESGKNEWVGAEIPEIINFEVDNLGQRTILY